MQSDTDFGVGLKASDPRAMARAGIDDDDGWFVRIKTIIKADIAHFEDFQKLIIGGWLETRRVRHKLILECQDRWHSRFLMGEHVVGALPQRVKKQNLSLHQVNPIGGKLIGALRWPNWRGRALVRCLAAAFGALRFTLFGGGLAGLSGCLARGLWVIWHDEDLSHF